MGQICQRCYAGQFNVVQETIVPLLDGTNEYNIGIATCNYCDQKYRVIKYVQKPFYWLRNTWISIPENLCNKKDFNNEEIKVKEFKMGLRKSTPEGQSDYVLDGLAKCNDCFHEFGVWAYANKKKETCDTND